jgi:hypothetical protein
MDIILLLLTLLCVAVAACACTYAVLVRRIVVHATEPAAASTAAPEDTFMRTGMSALLGDEDDFDDESEREPALPVDPTNPPQTRIYNPKGDRPRPLCFCHARSLVPGTEYLWWPMDDGSVRIYCKDRTRT